MSRLQYRGLIAGAAVVVALLSPRPTDAQVFVDPCLSEHSGRFLNTYLAFPYEAVDHAKAERRLQHVQAKYWRDAERGDLAAVDRDSYWIDRLKYRISMDEWLTLKNFNHQPCFYPQPMPIDCLSAAVIADFLRPSQAPYPYPYLSGPVPTPGSMGAVPTIPITIVNAEPAGAGVAFAIDGVAHQAAGGSRQDLSVAADSNINYDGGGSIGQRQYRLSPGLYEFRSTAEGWALYKLRGTP